MYHEEKDDVHIGAEMQFRTISATLLQRKGILLIRIYKNLHLPRNVSWINAPKTIPMHRVQS